MSQDEKLDLLLKRTEYLHKQLCTALEKLDTLEQRLAAQPAPQAIPQLTEDTTVFMAEWLIMTYDDNGQPRLKVQGGKWHKWGVPIYPEYMENLQLDIDSLRPGKNKWGKRVVAQLEDGNPKRVIDLA